MVVFLQATVARLAQPAERKALNLVVVGSSPTVGAFSFWGMSSRLPRMPCSFCFPHSAPPHKAAAATLLPPCFRLACLPRDFAHGTRTRRLPIAPAATRSVVFSRSIPQTCNDLKRAASYRAFQKPA